MGIWPRNDGNRERNDTDQVYTEAIEYTLSIYHGYREKDDTLPFSEEVDTLAFR